jgi:CRP-like cAMP-binding protein
MNAPAAELRHLPLFHSLTDAELAELRGVLKERRVAAGETLFREGDKASHLQILVEGELELHESGEPKLVLSPPAAVGELGALTGVARYTTAVARTSARLLEAETAALLDLFGKKAGLALAFHKALLDLVASKVRRDRVRMNEMRQNLVRTQKRMKTLRDLVLAAPETPISQPACEALDELIEHNRRAHYRVTPTKGHPATFRLDDKTLKVVELSEGFIKVESSDLAKNAEVTGVLVLPQKEMAVSARVERVGPDGVLLKLDLLIDEYKAALLGYVTQLQLLDFVV